jgi:WD40 repeat protein
LLAYGGTGPQILIWDVFQEKIVATLQSPSHKAGRSLAFSPDGLLLAAGGYDGSVRLWARASTETFDFRAIAQPVEEVGAGYAVAFSSTGVLATAKEDGSINLWDARPDSMTLLATLAGQHSGVVRGLAFSPDGNLLVSGGSDQTVVVWAVR